MNAPGRLWPRRLRHQLLLLLAVITALTTTLLYQLSTTRLDDVAHDAGVRWASAIARSAANAGIVALESGDTAALATAVRDLAGLPGVLRIDIVGADGAPLLALHHVAEGRVTAEYAPRGAPLPPDGARATRHLVLDGQDAVQSWTPAGRLGRFGVAFALEQERGPLQPLRLDAVLAIVLAGLVTIGAVYAFVLRALAPLHRLADFSGEIVRQPGARLDRPAGSREVAELTEALNDASATLHMQMAALGTAETRTHALLNAVPDVILGLGGGGRIGLVNPGVRSVFGLEPEDAMGRPLEELVPGLTRDEIESRTLAGLYMRASQTHVARFEIMARRHDGTEFPAEISLSRTETAEGVRYAALLRDMTEQRMASSMMNLFSRALECTTNGVVISDMSLPGSPVFYANPAFYRITGYEPGEAIGRNCGFLQRDDTAQPEIAELRAAVADGRSTQVVLRNYRKDGSLFFNELAIAPVDEDGSTIRHYVGVITDVTERERSRMAIAERSARLNAVFDLSPDGFVVFDREGRLVYGNRAFHAMTGLFLGAAADTVTLEDFDRAVGALCDPALPYTPTAQALEDASEVPDLLQLQRPERRMIARMARRTHDGTGETILFFRDITRETEVDRMKSEFLTTAAHELRTPMVSVYGFTELLLRRPVPDEKRRDMLETIHRQASLLINMVNELLDLARIEARQGKDLKREACRLDSLVTQAAGPLAIEGRHDLQIDIAHPDCVLHVDPEKTNRALTNVISNAVKYSPDGGTILVTTQSGELRGEPAVGLRVTDRGIGMSPEQLARVFERFYRADPSGNIPGTGLGMSLVKEIVELQGGRVDVTSTLGKGTSVTLWLPLATAAEAVPG